MCICNCPTIINTATARSQGNKSGGCAQQLGRQRKAFAYRKKKQKNQRTLKEMKHNNCLQRKSTQEREEERKRKQA
jgi:hypothetical protein